MTGLSVTCEAHILAIGFCYKMFTPLELLVFPWYDLSNISLKLFLFIPDDNKKTYIFYTFLDLFVKICPTLGIYF